MRVADGCEIAERQRPVDLREFWSELAKGFAGAFCDGGAVDDALVDSASVFEVDGAEYQFSKMGYFGVGAVGLLGSLHRCEDAHGFRRRCVALRGHQR